jgi:hypothetical protein
VVERIREDDALGDFTTTWHCCNSDVDSAGSDSMPHG